MLSVEEREWLNNYHRRVYETLSPYLDEAEKVWLKEATQAILSTIVRKKTSVQYEEGRTYQTL